MPIIKFEIYIKIRDAKNVARVLEVDDIINKKDAYIKVKALDDEIQYIIKSYNFNVGFVKNTFNDIIICLKPLIDTINKHSK